MFVCVNFKDEILLRGEECKTQVNLNFFQKRAKWKIVAIVQAVGMKFYKSRVMRPTSPLDLSHEI